MDRIWLDSYPRGIASEVDVHEHPSLVHLLATSCERFSARTAFVNMGVALTYGELDCLTRDFAAFLLHDLGLQRADRIAIMLPNVLQYPVVLFGALRAGLIVVNVNPLYTASELKFQLADAGAQAIVVLENFAHTVERALAGTAIAHVITTQLGDLLPAPRRWLVNFVVKYGKGMVPPWNIPGAIGLRSALARGKNRQLPGSAPASDDTAFLQYTGGTTGRAKGAILTHGNLVANVEQTLAWFRPTLIDGAETVVTALPLYHVFALTANLLLFVKVGGTNVLVTNPRDMPGFVRELRKTRFTVITGVNTLYAALLDTPGFDAACAAKRGALKLAVAGGMAMQKSVAERWQRVTGVPLLEGYGLTEASPIVCGNPHDTTSFSGKLGLPFPSTEVSIHDERGAELAPGEPGEIWVRGPQVMRGYWNAPDETAAVLTTDGWLKTGDIGCMDARGFVEFRERIKDVIVVSGFKAYPTEIEDVAMQHPGVKDAGAIGLPDAHSGEMVVLFVVRKDPALTASALQEHCAKQLTSYKRPRRIEFCDTLPKTPLGKISRRALRAQAVTR